jgi:EAL domain-containing protein (putative c-di-GMP-specific phosphodiesterase class I)
VTRASASELASRLAHDVRHLRLDAQPIVDTRAGEVGGYELLARLPEEWQIGPEELFAAADEAGVSAQITVQVLVRAVDLRDALPPGTFLTFNCSPRDLTAPAVLDAVSQLDLDRIFVELTEMAWPGDGSAVLEAADRVRAQGGRLAADDVGSGYGGLLQLIRLRPEIVKVDRDIVERMGRDMAAVALVTMLGDLADRLDAWVVAEGVEDQSQLSQLVGIGVPLVQGYYLGRAAAPWSDGEHCEEVRRWWPLREPDRPLVPYQRAAMTGELVLGPHGAVVGVRVPTEDGLREVEPLVMDSATTVQAALLRAMSRATPLERLAPMVLTDVTGQAVGVVSVERLVEVLSMEQQPALAMVAPDRTGG